jgi:hypothetical protein
MKRRGKRKLARSKAAKKQGRTLCEVFAEEKLSEAEQKRISDWVGRL